MSRSAVAARRTAAGIWIPLALCLALQPLPARAGDGARAQLAPTGPLPEGRTLSSVVYEPASTPASSG